MSAPTHTALTASDPAPTALAPAAPADAATVAPAPAPTDAAPVAPAPAVLSPADLAVTGLPPGPLTSAELETAVRDGGKRDRYVRIWHGMYRREDQSDDLRLRGLALTRTFPDGVLRGRSAALLWGDDSVPADAVPEIWLPSTRRASPGRVYRYGAMPREAVTEVDGMRVTTPLRTCRDLAADLPLGDAVVAVERMCSVDPGLASQLAAAAAHPSGGSTSRVARRFADVVDGIDPRAESVDESRARQLLVGAGYEGFGYRHEVRLARRTLALPLADPAARCVVVVRPDGIVPGDARWTDLRRAGWTVVVVTGPVVSTAVGDAAVGEANTVGTADDDGVADLVDVAAVLRSRWPATEVLEPVDGSPADDPHGIWAS